MNGIRNSQTPWPHVALSFIFLNTVDDQPFATMIPLDRPSPSGYARFQE
jgi:hypothetical protein